MHNAYYDIEQEVNLSQYAKNLMCCGTFNLSLTQCVHKLLTIPYYNTKSKII